MLGDTVTLSPFPSAARANVPFLLPPRVVLEPLQPLAIVRGGVDRAQLAAIVALIVLLRPVGSKISFVRGEPGPRWQKGGPYPSTILGEKDPPWLDEVSCTIQLAQLHTGGGLQRRRPGDGEESRQDLIGKTERLCRHSRLRRMLLSMQGSVVDFVEVCTKRASDRSVPSVHSVLANQAMPRRPRSKKKSSKGNLTPSFL